MSLPWFRKSYNRSLDTTLTFPIFLLKLRHGLSRKIV